MSDDISAYSNMWTTDIKEYLIIGRSPLGGSIFNVKQRTIFMIEDDSLARGILEEMLRAGVPVVEKFPSDPIDRIIEEMIEQTLAEGRSITEVNPKRRELIEAREKEVGEMLAAGLSIDEITRRRWESFGTRMKEKGTTG